MFLRLNLIARAMRRLVSRAIPGRSVSPEGASRTLLRFRINKKLVALAAAGFAGWWLVQHAPIETVPSGQVGIRINQFSGAATEWRNGSVLVLPMLHQLRIYSLRDQSYKPTEVAQANGSAPLQSLEGLSLGVDLTVRYALDPARLTTNAASLPDDIGRDVVAPVVQGVIYKVFARYTVREVFSTKRAEIAQTIEAEIKSRLAADGVLLKSVLMGKVDLPAEYKRGMEGLLAEELASEKMRYTIELKDKRVKENELDALADKAKRDVAAQATANEQVIAAKAQEEAMKHVLPFKQKQIEQRQLEAEAEKQARVKPAEGAAQARRIEANGEADARQKLADAEVYRLDKVGRVNSEQMAREGALVTRHPLLIQKALADKLSDKIQVIITPPPTDGGFIASALLGGNKSAMQTVAESVATPAATQKEQD